MTAVFNVFNEYIFSPFLRFFMDIFSNNFALAILVFTLVINIVLIPLNIKSQKTTLQQTRIKPKLDKLKEKCGDDKKKYSVAMQELYQKENVSMSGGCLPMIFRLVFLMSIYYLIISPISYLTTVDAASITAVKEGLGIAANNLRAELVIISKIFAPNFVAPEAIATQVTAIKDAIAPINFSLFGINLTETPVFTFNFANANINWIIPFLSFAAAMVSSLISMRVQKNSNPDAPSMKGMMLSTPLISLFIAFSAPCGLGFYWACSSLIGGLIQAATQYFYGPYKMLAKERAKKIIECNKQESKILSKYTDKD